MTVDVHEAQAIGAEQTNTACTRHLSQLGLGFAPFLVGLGKTRGKQHHAAHAGSYGVLQRRLHQVGWNGKNGEVDGRTNGLDRGVGLQALHQPRLRVDWINFPCETKALVKINRDAPDFADGIRGAHHGNSARGKNGGQGVLALLCG